MSSDSDIDYESADEDTNINVKVQSKNNNTPPERQLESLKTDTVMIRSESHETQLAKSDPCVKDIEIADSSLIEATSDTNRNNVKEIIPDLSSEVGNVFTEEPPVGIPEVSDIKDNVKVEKPIVICKDNIKIENNETTIDAKNIEEIEAVKIRPEKQRVPLRLEKKMQQKSQISEDSSVDKLPSDSENALKQNEVKSSSWGFGSWGTSLLSTAASSVSTFTNQVSQGIGTVLETVESTLGAPAPEELAATLSKNNESSDSAVGTEAENEDSVDEIKEENSSETRSSLLPNVSSWTKVFENTGTKVIMGGLDTLELIGKKTIDIITEGDPGLRNKRSVFADGVTLSQILREAKAEADESKQDTNSQGIDPIHYSQLFDEYQGLVHLEALEMLSKQSEAKIHRNLMRVPRNSEVRRQLEEIKSICENLPLLDDPDISENFEDFDTVCKKHIIELNLPFNVENLIKAQKRITDVVKSYESATTVTSSPEEIYQSAICSLAEFTAKSIETFHKLSELILVQPIVELNAEHFATNLTGLTTLMCIEINSLSSRYHHCLDFIAEQSEESDSQRTNVTTIVTNLYVEASNSNKYIQDAFLLLVPVLQVSQLESCQ